jgi:hypothetical protein
VAVDKFLHDVRNTHGFEKHSTATLARRFEGLASRNTLQRWIETGRLRPVMRDRSPAPYLFRRETLDQAAKELEQAHAERLRSAGKTGREAARIRAQVRRDCLAVINHNVSAEFSRQPQLRRRERDPALNTGDAVGAATLDDSRPTFTISNCTLSGKHFREVGK